MQRNPFRYHYSFKFEDGRLTEFPIALDPVSLSLLPRQGDQELPEWTSLSYKQCEQCPLSEQAHPNCPVAVNLMDLVETFKSVFSYNDCEVMCKTADRTYVKQTSVMEGLSSIFGMIMATSDCPFMEFLKPMARFHLPFATIEETTVRSASMFLLAQYFNPARDAEIDFDFKSLEEHYAKVQLVNEGLLNRINSVSSEDADKNAIITLHSLSQFLSMEIAYSLSSLDYVFLNRYQF